MADVEVQTTIFQNPIRVPEDEVATLRAQGLLVEGPPEDKTPPGADDKAKTAGDGSKEKA